MTIISQYLILYEYQCRKTENKEYILPQFLKRQKKKRNKIILHIFVSKDLAFQNFEGDFLYKANQENLSFHQLQKFIKNLILIQTS